MKKPLLYAGVIFVLLFSCKKKETSTSDSSAGTNNPPATVNEKYAAVLTINNEIGNDLISSNIRSSNFQANFYSKSGLALQPGILKLGATFLPYLSGNKAYMSSINGDIYEGGVFWQLFSDDTLPDFPDTTLNVISIGDNAFTQEKQRVYDKTKDFVIKLAPLDWDTLVIEMGGVKKKVTRSTDTTYVTFKPEDKVYVNAGSTDIRIALYYYNYKFIMVRNRKWKFFNRFKFTSYYTLIP